MKITRFKTKYRVDCTERQFLALKFLAWKGLVEVEKNPNLVQTDILQTIRECQKFNVVPSDAMSVDIEMRERDESK